MVDLVLYSLSNITYCNVLVYYFRNKNLNHQLFSPFNNHAIGEIEIVLLNGHYDLICNMADEHSLVLTDNPKNAFNGNDQDIIELSDSLCKVGNYNAKVKYGAVSKTESEIIHNDMMLYSKETISIPSDDNDYITDIEEEGFYDNDITSKFKSTEDIIFCGSKKYISPDIFNIPVFKLNSVPDDINDLAVYEVPIQETLANCKGLRPSCTSQTSKSSTFTKGPCLLLNCRGCYICTNTRCPNIQDFGVNRHDFIMHTASFVIVLPTL